MLKGEQERKFYALIDCQRAVCVCLYTDYKRYVHSGFILINRVVAV
jgi:hypothetical protein